MLPSRVLALLVLTAALSACSSDDDDAPDAGGVPDGSPSVADAASGDPDATPSLEDAALADAAPPDANTTDAAIEQCGRIRCDCTFNGIQLFGRVQYVTNFADVQVRESSFPDLRVREGSFADSCGEWEIVTASPDFTVEIVTAFPDFDIQYSNFPGIP